MCRHRKNAYRRNCIIINYVMLEVDVYIERGKTTAEVVDAVTSEMQDEEDDVEMLTDVTQQSDVCIDSLRSIRCWRKTGTSSTFSLKGGLQQKERARLRHGE